MADIFELDPILKEAFDLAGLQREKILQIYYRMYLKLKEENKKLKEKVKKLESERQYVEGLNDDDNETQKEEEKSRDLSSILKESILKGTVKKVTPIIISSKADSSKAGSAKADSTKESELSEQVMIMIIISLLLHI